MTATASPLFYLFYHAFGLIVLIVYPVAVYAVFVSVVVVIDAAVFFDAVFELVVVVVYPGLREQKR